MFNNYVVNFVMSFILLLTGSRGTAEAHNGRFRDKALFSSFLAQRKSKFWAQGVQVSVVIN